MMYLEIVLFLGLVFAIDYYRRLHVKQSMPSIPIVSNIPFIGTFLELLRLKPDNLTEMWHKYVLRYGKTYYALVFGNVILITIDHGIVRNLLKCTENLNKSQLYLLLDSWLGKGLLLNSGNEWHTMRRIITPTFHFSILERFVEVFDRQTDIFISKLEPLADGQTVVNIFEPMGLLTLDIIAESAMGVSVNAQMDSRSEFVQAVKEVTEIIATRFVRPHLAFPKMFKFLAPNLYRTQTKGIKIMHNFTENIIAERRQYNFVNIAHGSVADNIADTGSETASEPSDNSSDADIKPRKALLDVLLGSIMDDGLPLTDKQIRDEVNTFMFEGHDTTTSAISFCLYQLSRHSAIQQRVFEELQQQFGNDDAERPVTYTDLLQLNYLNCVIKETLRLYPPVAAIGRWLKTDLKEGDVTLRAGTNVIIPLFEMMRDPDIIEDPLTFKPERHLESSAPADVFVNIPFSAGPRNCVGQRFAMFEMRTVIAKVIRRFELLPLGEEIQLSVSIVLRSKNGMNLGLRHRIYN